MRPASGYGSSMAFEDVIVLCRRLLNTEHLSKVDNTNTAYCKTLIGDDEKVVSALQAYESERLKRVAVIHTQQKLLAESPKPVQSTCPKFQQWVHAGI
jgi:2-polyprenyl-6-methoxyphenol hydroxylase-like FAD-dependent oxidoreductase